MNKHDMDLTSILIGLTIYLLIDNLFDIGGNEFALYVVLVFIVSTLVLSIYRGTKEDEDVIKNTDNVFIITEVDGARERLIAYRHTKEEAEQAIEELKRPNKAYRYRQLKHAIDAKEYE